MTLEEARDVLWKLQNDMGRGYAENHLALLAEFIENNLEDVADAVNDALGEINELRDQLEEADQ